MASEVMHTALDRLVAEGRVPAGIDVATRLWQPERLEGSVALRSHEVDVAERPPLNSIQRPPLDSIQRPPIDSVATDSAATSR
jgi:hypothetical protein